MEMKKVKKQEKKTKSLIENGFLMSSYPLTNFKMQIYYHNEHRFNGVYSRDNLYKIKDGAYIINLDD